jgi:integrase
MASVEKRGDRWLVRYREAPGGPQRYKTFNRAKDAQRFRIDVEADVQRGDYVDPSAGQVALVEAMEAFVARHPYRHNTLVNARNAIGHVRVFFGGRPIAAVRPSDVQAFVSQLQLEPRTVGTVAQYLRGTLRDAVADGLITRDPSARLKLPKHQGAELVVPTAADVVALRAAAPEGFEVAVTLAAGLGLRAGELAGLTVDNVDWLRREVRVTRQWHGKLDRFEPVKSGSSVRTVPAGDRVLEQLAEHKRVYGTGEHGVLVHTETGQPLNSNRMDHRWKLTTTSAGLTMRLHDLRHHYVSSLISAGCSIVAVQRAVGHSSAAITLGVYSHLMPSDGDRIRGAVDAAWNDAEYQLSTDAERKSL